MGERLQAPSSRANLVLILACERSGSTLLRAMLSAHPGLFCPPELNLLSFPSLGDREEVMDPRQCWGLNQGWMNAGDLSREEAEGVLASIKGEGCSQFEVYERLMAMVEGRTLVDKSPLYSRDPEGLKGAATYFGPRLRCIHLVRHPKSVIDSLARLTQIHLSKQTDPPPIAPYETAEAGWYDSNRTILDFLGGLDPQHQLRLRYEDLVEKPEASIGRTLAFLNQPDSTRCLEPHRYGEMLKSPFPGALTGDPTFLTRSRIDPTPARMVNYLRISLREETQALARALGYGE